MKSGIYQLDPRRPLMAPTGEKAPTREERAAAHRSQPGMAAVSAAWRARRADRKAAAAAGSEAEDREVDEVLKKAGVKVDEMHPIDAASARVEARHALRTEAKREARDELTAAWAAKRAESEAAAKRQAETRVSPVMERHNLRTKRALEREVAQLQAREKIAELKAKVAELHGEAPAPAEGETP